MVSRVQAYLLRKNNRASVVYESYTSGKGEWEWVIRGAEVGNGYRVLRDGMRIWANSSEVICMTREEFESRYTEVCTGLIFR